MNDQPDCERPVFPSPCGEKVGINNEPMEENEMAFPRGFPSPCGEKVGINFDGDPVNLLLSKRFRPLAGKR